MESKKNISITVGLGAILIGAFLYSIADDLKVIKKGVELPNEGGYVRFKTAGAILIASGLGMFSYGVYVNMIKK